MISQSPQTIKSVLVGPPKCGKSCLCTGYTDNYQPTIGLDCSRHTYNIGGKDIEFELWDISASMTFNDKNLEEVKRGDVVVLLYDVSDMSSFGDCQQLAERLLKEDRMRYDAKVLLVGTKTDLPVQVSYQQGLEAASTLKGSPQSQTEPYIQLSSKTDENPTQKLCQAIHKIHNDPTYKTVSQLQQSYSPQQPAPYSPQTQPQAFTITITNKPQVAHPKQPPQFTRLYKVILMGDEACGKSCIMTQFVQFKMLEGYVTTIGVDFAIRTIDVMGERVKLQIWDTAGMKKFQVISSCYIKGCQAAILVFDASNYTTFKNLPEHIEQVNKHSSNPQKMVKFIVANKIDKQRQVSKQQAEEFAHKNRYQYLEVSALQRINIDELFYFVSDNLIKNQGSTAPK